MKNSLVTLVKLVVTVALIAFLLLRVDLALVGAVFARANLWLLLLALILYFVAIFIGVLKWRVLVAAQDIAASFSALLATTFVSLFFGNFLPSNIGGDFVRGYDLARATRGRAEAAAISVLVDRLMGLVSFFSVAVVTATLATLMLAQAAPLEQIEIATVIAASLFLTACALLFSRRITRRAAVVFDFGPLFKLKPFARRVYDAMQVYRFRYRALALNVSLSLSIVVLTALIWYIIGQAVGITETSYFYFLLFNPLIAFVLLIPISFNGLGTKEATVVFFFSLIGVAQERALAMSLLFHLIILVTSLPGGVLWLRRRSLTPETPRPASPLPNDYQPAPK